MIKAIDHIAIVVRNIDRALAYYTEVLNLPLVHDETLPQSGVRLAYLSAGNTMLQLVQPIGETPVKAFLEKYGEGLHHICFAVDDIPSWLETLEGEQDARVGLGGRNRRTCFLRNEPNGLRIEVTEIEEVSGGNESEKVTNP
jgi:methylmalonyl-CoA epimerase